MHIIIANCYNKFLARYFVGKNYLNLQRRRAGRSKPEGRSLANIRVLMPSSFSLAGLTVLVAAHIGTSARFPLVLFVGNCTGLPNSAASALSASVTAARGQGEKPIRACTTGFNRSIFQERRRSILHFSAIPYTSPSPFFCVFRQGSVNYEIPWRIGDSESTSVYGTEKYDCRL